MKKLFFFLLILTTISCDEIDKIFNQSSDEYLIEKTISASTTEQVVESGSEFKMIFPANSISNNLGVKVKMESSVTVMNIPNQKPGKNFYRIKFSGDTEFLHPVKLIINFDKSDIPSGKTAQESVFGYIYSSGAWKLADYQLDEPNGKIIISISSFLGKVNKDEPILLVDGEIIIGDSYTTTDTGQSDNPLSRYNFFSILLISNIVYDDGDTDDDTQWEYNFELNSPAIKWNGNDFSFRRTKIEPKDWITDYETEPDSTIEIGFGTVAKNGTNLIKFKYDYYYVSRTYYGSSDKPDLKITQKSYTLNNLSIDLPDLILYPNSYPYEEVTGTEVGNYIIDLKWKYYSYRWDSFYNKDVITEKNSVSYNWNGSYSRLSIYFQKLANLK